MGISKDPEGEAGGSSSAAAQERKDEEQPVQNASAGEEKATANEKIDQHGEEGVRKEKDGESQPMEIDRVAEGSADASAKDPIVTEQKAPQSEKPQQTVQNVPPEEGKKEPEGNVPKEKETQVQEGDLKQDPAESEEQRRSESKVEDSNESTANANEKKSNDMGTAQQTTSPLGPMLESQKALQEGKPCSQNLGSEPSDTFGSSQRDAIEASAQQKPSQQNPSQEDKPAQQSVEQTSGVQLQNNGSLQASVEETNPVADKEEQQIEEPKKELQEQQEIKEVKGEQAIPSAPQQPPKAQIPHQAQAIQAQALNTLQTNVVPPKPVIAQVQQSAQTASRPSPTAAQATPQVPEATSTQPKPAAATTKPLSATAKMSSQPPTAPLVPLVPPALPAAIQRPSRALQVARLIINFLGPNHPPPQNPQLPTLNALRTRLSTNPNYYDTHHDHLAWQVREAIRTEFFKVLYPAPPPNSLLNLVTSTESILAPFPPRPFFFPGARVAVPTEAGSRRAATSLQLRFKQVGGTTVAEALLHLDGPHGGGFQWVQAPALTPLSLYAPHAARVIQKKPKKPKIAKPVRPRKRKERVIPSPPPIPPKTNGKPAYASTPLQTRGPVSIPATAQTIAPTKTPTASAPTRSMPSPPNAVPASASATPARLPPPRMASVVARLARQEASGVHVPDALRGTSPPPRERIVGDGRFLSHVSGAMRAATLDIDKMLGIERLVARRETDIVEYFVKWSGVPLREGSWESREALLQDVPALVRDFDVRHPERNRDRIARSKEMKKREATDEKNDDNQSEKAKVKDDSLCSSDKERGLSRKASFNGEIVMPLLDGKKGDDEKEDASSGTHYTDDVTGLPIPSWLDTPIVELNIAGMVLQIRRPNESVLHNDATSAVRDARKRQTRFKQENILLGERLFPLTKFEAKSVIDAAAKDHRLHNRAPIPFPKGIGRVSPTDHGHPFSKEDALKAPPSWEAYFLHLGMTPTDYSRSLPPYMPTLDDVAQSKVLRVREDLAYATAFEHRERARLLLRESFRHTGVPPPEHLFRDGIRAPPESRLPTKRKRSLSGKSSDESSRALLRAREPAVEAALKKAKKLTKGKKDAWFDEIWGCWRPAPSS